VLNEPASERRGDDGDLEALERDATNRSCPVYSLYVRRRGAVTCADWMNRSMPHRCATQSR
jgi:hypothetical protein